MKNIIDNASLCKYMNEVLKDNQGNILNPKIPRYEKKTEYILATITSAQTISSNYKVNLQSVVSSHGDKLTLSTEGANKGKIIVGEGVSKLEISASIFINNWHGGTNYLWGRIMKNSENVAGNIIGSTAPFVSSSIPSTIVEVEEGDVITLIADSGAGGSLRTGVASTWLLVEVFE